LLCEKRNELITHIQSILKGREDKETHSNEDPEKQTILSPVIRSVMTDGFVIYPLIRIRNDYFLTSSIVDEEMYILILLFLCIPFSPEEDLDLIVTDGEVPVVYSDDDEEEVEEAVEEMKDDRNYNKTSKRKRKIFSCDESTKYRMNDDDEEDDNGGKGDENTTTKEMNDKSRSQQTQGNNNSRITTRSMTNTSKNTQKKEKGKEKNKKTTNINNNQLVIDLQQLDREGKEEKKEKEMDKLVEYWKKINNNSKELLLTHSSLLTHNLKFSGGNPCDDKENKENAQQQYFRE